MLLTPEYIFKNVEAITPEFLRQLGVTALVLDVDNTLTGDGSQQLDDSVAAWLDAMRAAGVSLTIVSNNTAKRVRPFAARIGLAFVPLAWSWTLPVIGFWLFAALSLLLAAYALVYICRFRLYRPMYQVLLNQSTSSVQLNVKKITDENYRKSISADTAITSHKKGYAYFNELFVKRHQKLLLRYAKRMALITLALVAAAAAALVAFPQAREVANELVLMFLPYFIFLI